MERLKKIAAVLCKEQTDYLELSETIRDYTALAFEISNIHLEDDLNKNDIHFENGKALGTTSAALCIKDPIRTKTFIKGLFNAIEHVKKTKKDPVHIFYAGTGPFATLLLPVLATYSKEEVQCTLLEINEVSFNSVNHVIETLGFSGYIKASVNEDATIYVIDPKEDIDIVISETMQRALEKEQQVPIVINIMNQIKEEAILIPEDITLDLCLLNMIKLSERQENTNEEDYCIRLGDFFTLNRKKIVDYNQTSTLRNGRLSFPEKQISIPLEHLKDFNQLAVLTEIQVFGKDKISIQQSGLTTPLILEDFSVPTQKNKVTIKYKIDDNPGIEYQLN
ncbi:hypothetical protein [Aquimarina muelleri]|uniref:PRMT5 arginine-N-methyltransferase domain-containing protein n=1 Tax=Aquimarina muelleri TaxID=279356 RepID=A0A918N1T5_9FLAO|nr:hypothetical protein [Aquimarina muelleri]MCX2764698.1 hypothetical protein [Aquimarina muelleri]GGX05307.1 hypothetical protein GCM10007384_03760 [Aquimarina muelleri]